LDWISNPEIWTALLTLTALEIVLGIDNIIFISILAGKLPVHQRDRARVLGLAAAMITRILLLFSLDSVITAVGMAKHIEVMVAAVVISVAIMLVASGPISRFVDQHPTVKILALSFLLLIGTSLVAESFDQHIPKGYIYFAMGFSVLVEALNLRVRKPAVEPVQLHNPRMNEEIVDAAGRAGR
jgi:predicted tellurium resistance membrane protein TerC